MDEFDNQIDDIFNADRRGIVRSNSLASRINSLGDEVRPVIINKRIVGLIKRNVDKNLKYLKFIDEPLNASEYTSIGFDVDPDGKPYPIGRIEELGEVANFPFEALYRPCVYVNGQMAYFDHDWWYDA